MRHGGGSKGIRPGQGIRGVEGTVFIVFSNDLLGESSEGAGVRRRLGLDGGSGSGGGSLNSGFGSGSFSGLNGLYHDGGFSLDDFFVDDGGDVGGLSGLNDDGSGGGGGGDDDGCGAGFTVMAGSPTTGDGGGGGGFKGFIGVNGDGRAGFGDARG